MASGQPHKSGGFDFLEHLAPDSLRSVEAESRELDVAVGQIVSVPGAPADAVFVVRRGQIAATLHGPSRRGLLLATLGPGDLFGEIGVLSGQARLRRTQADSAGRLLRVPAPTFEAVLKATPGLERRMLRHLADMVGDVSDRLYEIAVHDVETRVRLLLVRLLRRAGALQDGGRLDPAPSHARLSAQIGTNREAVSRALSALAKRGVIETGRRVIVVRDSRGLVGPGADRATGTAG